ncbi:type II secretion system protein [Citricoccus nitrophenolicus]|uniref:type II secretion system protein n=1 Tax=Citricoccus nitrophenolicus TaxID=863575 RepID=UPI0031E4F786
MHSIASTVRARLHIPRSEDAFTLLELLIVILMIGTLTATAIPVFASFKKGEQDRETTSTLKSVASVMQANADKGHRGANFSLADFHPESMKLSADKGVVLRSERTETGYCLTAYHADGHKDSSDPMLFDSTLDVRGEITSETTANCGTKQLSTPAYFINDTRELERVTPSGPLSPENNACAANIATGVHLATAFYADTTMSPVSAHSVQRSTLLGTMELSADCSTVSYSLRVENADPGTTYSVPVQPSALVEQETEVGVVEFVRSHGEQRTLTFEGTRTLTGSIPTGITHVAPMTTVSLDGLRTAAISLESNYNVAWGPADTYPVVPSDPRNPLN